jgi:membrane protease YdiL (CAAX protease family)
MTTRWKVIRSPPVRIVLALLLVGGAVFAAEITVKALEGVLSLRGAVPAIYYAAYLIVGVFVAYFVYRAYVRLVERRHVTELSWTGAPNELGAGILIGLGLAGAIIGILWLLGDYQITGFGLWTAVFVLLANDGAGAFVEEILLRGIIFRITEESLGTWIALAISAMLFVLLHLLSPGATVAGAIIVGIEGGILLSAAYVLTRRLWLAIGIHFAWDFAQDALGVGSGAEGLVRAELTGQALLAGGKAGLEGSLVTLVLVLVVSIYLLLRARRRANFLEPFWRRRRVHPSNAPVPGANGRAAER